MPARNASETTRFPDLPVAACMPTLRNALQRGHAVLSAAPGSGKTTLVPLLLRNEPWLQGQRILVLEPRRPAARMAARRMAQLLNEPLGAQVGYQVRFERKLSAATRIEVLTEGLLVRRLQSDPELTGVGLVIFDEFHERHLQADLSLALCLDVVKGLRSDLRLLVMSATLDAEPLHRLLDAEVVTAQGQAHAVTCHYDDRDAEPAGLVPSCMRLLAAALSDTSGDVLVFLPGRREIDDFVAAASNRFSTEPLKVLPLHGDLDSTAQDRVLNRPGDATRRVIAATDIAETSLTIEGLTAVVDGGFARRPRFNPRNGMTRLETRRISRASATQRAGRAGRLGPGHAYRAWTRARHERLEAQGRPEILDADLSPSLLEICAWGARPASLDWLDGPPEAAWSAAHHLLTELGAIGPAGTITEQGKAMVRFPVNPRLAHLLASSRSATDQGLAVDVAAVLSERDPLRGPGRQLHGADLRVRLDLLAEHRAGQRPPPDVDRGALANLVRTATQYRRLLPNGITGELQDLSIARALLLAYPDRLAQLASDDGRRYRLRNGRAAGLRIDDPLVGSEFLIVADLDAGEREGRIYLAAQVERTTIEEVMAAAVTAVRELRWDDTVGDVVAREVRRIDAVVLADRAVPLRSDDAVMEVLATRIERAGIDSLFELPESLMARVALMRRLEPARGWPDFSPEGLQRECAAWLGPWMTAAQGGLRQLRQHKVEEMLRAYLGHELTVRLDQQLPTQWITPAGTRRPIVYRLNDEPLLAVPMQEMFGEAAAPRLADGRIEVLLHLLSPAGRPLQITRDLPGFWRGAYDEVKKEMRGRYPKHHWPDDPASAEACRSLKRPRRGR